MSTPNSAATPNTRPALGTPENPSSEQCQEIFKAKATCRNKASTPEQVAAARDTLAKYQAMGGKLKDFSSSAGQTLGSVTFAGFSYGLLDIEGPEITCQTLPTTNMATTASTAGAVNETHIPSAYVKGDNVVLTVQDDPAVWPPVGTQGSLTIVSGPNATSQSGTATLNKFTSHKPRDGKVMTANATFELSGPFGAA